MEPIQTKTPAVETSESNTSIIPKENILALSQKEPEFLTKTVQDMERLSIIRNVIDHYKAIHGWNGILKDAIETWNNQYCLPPLEKKELEQILAFYHYNISEDKQIKELKIPKGKHIYDVVMSDKTIKLFHDQNQRPYARVQIGERFINMDANSTDFINYVRRHYYKQTNQTASDIQIKEALSMMSLLALYESEQHHLYHRVAQCDDSFYYDLINSKGEVVKVNEFGWEVVSSEVVPFLFKQGTGKEQVTPRRGGSLKDLLELVNIKDPEGQMLYLSTLPVRLIRDVDQAIAYLYGPAGSAKTTLLKMTKDLLDPSKGGISMPIRNVEDARVLLNQTWIFANDNISRIDDDLSDFLCVVATGGESSRRKLYSDSDITVLSAKNPAYLTGINVEAYKSDLLSRILLFKTSIVPDEQKLGDEIINKKFVELKPFLLGALFDVLSQAIRIKKTLTHKTGFRMVDFALWGSACAEALGYGAENFEKVLHNSVEQRAYDAIYSLSAGRALLEYIDDNGSYEGTVTELFKKLKENYSNEWHEAVANNPASLGKKLRELENSLSVIGIRIDFANRSGSERRIIIKRTGTTLDAGAVIQDNEPF